MTETTISGGLDSPEAQRAQAETVVPETEPPAVDAEKAAAKAKRKQRRRKRGRLLARLGLLVSVLGLIAGQLSNLWIGFDVFAQFTLHFCIAAIAFFVASFIPGLRLQIALLLMAAGVAGLGLYPLWFSDRIRTVSEVHSNERALRLMSFNTLFTNDKVDEIAAEIGRLDPDIVTLVEFGPDKKPLLPKMLASYPYQYNCLSEDYCNLVVLSKFPFASKEARVGWEGPPAIRVTFGPDLGNLTVIGVHTIRFPHSRSQLRQVTALAKLMENYLGNRVIMGDFNATPYSIIIQTFEQRTGMHRLSGLPSWPSQFGLPQIAIDHVFVSNYIRTLESLRIGKNAGSDHYPVVVKVAVPLDLK